MSVTTGRSKENPEESERNKSLSGQRPSTTGRAKSIDWPSILAATDFSSLLSEDYSLFIPALKAGLAAFFQGLPHDVQLELLSRLMDTQAHSLAERLGCLARSSPVLHKIAQTLARNRKLAPALRRELQKLEWLPPSVSMRELEKTLIREIGPLTRHGIRLAPRPLAEASVAVVIPFSLSGSEGALDDNDYTGVFKILKPGIEERLQQELTLLPAVGESLDNRCLELDIPAIEYEETFRQVADILSREIRLTDEQQNLAAAAASLSSNSQVVVPGLFGPSSPRVTAMERIRGVKLDPANIASLSERRRLATILLRALVVQPALTQADAALFHGDPHAGNLLYTDDRQLAILDWSLTGTLKGSTRSLINHILLGAQGQRHERITDLIVQLAEKPPPNRSRLTALVRRSLNIEGNLSLPGLSWLITLMDRTVTEEHLRLPMEMVLYRKALMTVLALSEDLTEDPRQADRLLYTDFLRQIAVEWPLRWFYPPFSRNLPSRLSTADLTEAALLSISAASRCWLSSWGVRLF